LEDYLNFSTNLDSRKKIMEMQKFKKKLIHFFFTLFKS